MRITLEHSDVVKALALYVRTKGFIVEATPENFVIANESDDPKRFDLLVTVKNADTAPVEVPAPRLAQRSTVPAPLRPTQPSDAARPGAPALPAPKKNDLYRPVAPPQLVAPPPKHRVLDKQALSSPALMLAGQHPHMPRASAVVQAFDGSDRGAEEPIDEPVARPARRATPTPSESSLIIDPEDMSDEDRSVFNDILARSVSRAEDGPHFAADSDADPIQPGGHVEDE